MGCVLDEPCGKCSSVDGPRSGDWGSFQPIITQEPPIWPASALGDASEEAFNEASKAMDAWPPMNSAHEGYGVLLEEVDELWAHVKTKQKNRDLSAMRKEAIQVAAMALRFAVEICNEERGRK